MKIACSCMVMVLLMSGCATTGKVDQMIDSKVAPQIELITAQLDAQAAVAAVTLEDMKSFVDRLGTTLDNDVKAVESSLDGLKSQLAAVKKDADSTTSDVKGVDAQVSKLDSSVQSLSRNIDSLKDSVEVLKAQTADAKAAADAATKTAARAISGSAK